MLSLLDSCTSYKEYIDMAKEYGQESIAITEHGNIYQWIGKKLYCDQIGIKYIHGVEIYLTEKLEPKIRDNYHTVLLAKNIDGLKEINLLVGESTKEDHFYYKPRISFDEFLSISDNIITMSACLQSPLNKLPEENPYFKKLLKKYDFFEVQPHSDSQEQKDFNKKLLKYSKELNKKLVATNDVHSSTKYKAECRKVLQKAKNIHFKGDNTNQLEDKFDLTFKTGDEMFEEFIKQGVLSKEQIISAIENTCIISNMCEEIVIDKSFKYPKISDNDEDLLKKTINENYSAKIKSGAIKGGKKYIDQIQEEFRVFKKLNMITFMLFMSQLITWCRENGIPIGPSRGSVAGSLIAYLTNITEVDPIRWGTIFSRFANENRVSMPDVDCDFPTDSREMVYQHIFDVFGYNKVAYVLSIGTLAERATIDEIGRSLEYNLDLVSRIKKEYEENKDKTKEKYKELFYYFDGILNTAISQSIHPAGIIVSEVNLPTEYGVFWKDNNPIMQLDMEDCHSAGLCKYDILGLKNIDIIRDTCSDSGIKYPSVDRINFKDENVWNDMTKSSVGLFEFEGGFAFDSLRKFKPKTIDDVSLVNAAIRPSGASYRDSLLKRIENKNPTKEIDDVFKISMGYCVEENQLVSTVNGPKKIKDINIDDVVYTKNGTGQVINKINMGKKETVKISTESGNIICTKDHKILTENGWVEAQFIKRDCCIAYRIGNCSKNDYSKEKLMLIGYLLGDGILNSHNNISFVNQKIDVINNFKCCVEKSFEGLTCSITNRHSRVNNLDLYYANVRHIGVSRKETEMSKYLKDIGIKYANGGGCLAKEKFIPSFIFSLSKECLLCLIGAYTDTDSHFDAIKKSITYKTASEQLAKDLVEVGRLIGYKFIVRKSENAYCIVVTNCCSFINDIYDYCYKIRNNILKEEVKNKRAVPYSIVNTKTIIDIVEDKNIIKKHIMKKNGVNLYQKTKYISIDNVKKIYNDYKEIDSEQTKCIINNNLIWIKVEKNEKYIDSYVYDLEVKDEHSFCCNGFIVHNCVFQESIAKFLNEICGFSPSSADSVRRLIANKDPEKINAEIPNIVKGYCENSKKPYESAKKEIDEFIKVIVDASRYAFGLNHSIGYSIIAYYCAYFRYYYPGQFVTAYLNNANNTEDIQDGSELARIKNIKIEPAKFRKSIDKYVYNKEENIIYKGLESVKYISPDCAKELYEMRMIDFECFTDLLTYLSENSTINSRQVKVLIYIGFFEEFGTVGKLLDIYNLFINRYKKTYVEKTKQTRISEIKEYEKRCKNTQIPISEQIKQEKEYLGYISATFNISKRVCYVSEIDLKYTPRVDLYCFTNGKIATVKINKTIYAKNKIKEGDIILCKKFVKKLDWKKTDNGWEKSNTTSHFLQEYDIIPEEKFERILK